MKRSFLLLAMGVLLSVPVLAQSQGGAAGAPPANPPHNKDGAPPGGGGGHMGGLSPEERQELMSARKAAMDANPDLAAEQKALQEKINAAMIKADPKVAPLIAKMDAARKQREAGGDKPAGN